MKINSFAKFVWIVLGVNILVILWGALVRATGSGAGCGSHWPTCNGELIPLNPSTGTMIEFTHRLSSGVALILVILMAVLAFRQYSKDSPVRIGAISALFFIIVEAAIGAGLVLFELVAENDSATRAITIAIHLANTFLLLGSITLTGWWASGGGKLYFESHKPLFLLFIIGLCGILFLGMSGAITALGDTLFPAANLLSGLQQDFSAASHFLLRLRVFHPFIAVFTGLYLLVVAMVAILTNPTTWVKRFSAGMLIVFFLQILVGLINVVLLAPVYIQLIHLFLADTIWIVFVLLSAATFSIEAKPVNESTTPQSAPVMPHSSQI